ncbi:hypothetical protein BKA63DRAFT_570701 [Paraphoma chrysanthemicola]|nr:hypothetical protein BKA63DRAFT_570701 [Paraphoma chrysanthemicola]
MASSDEECKLEPELEEAIGCLFWDEPWSVKINSAFKTFKTQMESDKRLPTNSELRRFLDLQGTNFAHGSESGKKSWRRAKDVTLLYIISGSEKLDSAKLRSILRETPDQQRSLLHIAIQHSLWRSVALMLAYGATSGTGSTAEQVVASIDLNETSREDRDFLDLSTLATDSNEPYYCTGFHRSQERRGWVFCCIHDLLQYRAPWLEGTTPGEAISNCFHVPSTNGLIILAIIAAIRGFGSSQYLAEGLFYNNFNSSNVASGDRSLNYRKTTYCSEKWLDMTVVVFPTLMMTTLGQHSTGKLSTKCTVHFERTLDETYFPGLTVTDFEERNADQVISSSYSEDTARRPIIIVPQLWLWQYRDVLISAHSVPRDAEGFTISEHSTVDEKRKVWEPEYGYPFASRKATMAILIARYVKSFGMDGLTLSGQAKTKAGAEGSDTGHNETNEKDEREDEVPPILDLFERQVVRILSEVKRYMVETPRKRIIYAKEEAFHHQLSDCRSELAMVQHVLNEQASVITPFREDLTQELEVMKREGSDSEEDGDNEFVENALENALRVLNDALTNLKEYEQRILKIEGDADRVEKNVQDLLNLKRTFASVQDSHASVLLGLAAFAFAIVTIVFAPLAFLTAFFALDVQGFDKLRISKPEPKETPMGTSAAPDGNIVAIEAKEGPVYHGGKMAGMLVGSVLTTVLVTGTLVFLLMKHTGIELSDLRFEKQPKPEAKNKKNNNEREAKTDSWTAWSSVRRAVAASTSYVKKRKPTGARLEVEVKKDGAVTGTTEVRPPVDDLEAQREIKREREAAS